MEQYGSGKTRGRTYMPFNAYDEHYFLTATPFINGNEQLREPQKNAYNKVCEHFMLLGKKNDAIIVIPTGVGKTGLMGLIPYGICNGRVLVITPQITIKDTVIDSWNPDNVDNFWMKRRVFRKKSELPVLVEYYGEIKREVLDSSNIVVINVQKLQTRLEKSPLNSLEEDYFDMIIIDEAHHSIAKTWVETINHFKNAKVVKVTGTPIRTDGVKLAGELVYKYKLSQAMAAGYVKSLKNIEYVPQKLLLSIDNDESKLYTVDELLELGLKDEDWISRSVAYSRECSERVVDTSIQMLEQKRSVSSVPHKIIAVACSVEHAKKIKELYRNHGYRAEVIYSEMPETDKEKIKKDIENHRLDVIVNIMMLGEGYDHPYLSIAAIFRPFKHPLPYEQFIGRVLRAIPEGEVQNIQDNIAVVVSHKHLGLSELWEQYKIEIQESEIIKQLQEFNEITDITAPIGNGETKNDLSYGTVSEKGGGSLSEDVYLTTELIKQHKKEQEEMLKKVAEIQRILSVNQDTATKLYLQSQVKEEEAIKRPDLYFASKKKDLDIEIREIIIPHLITSFNIDQKGNNLLNCGLYDNSFSWIKGKNVNNGASLAMYFNDYLRKYIGKARDKWSIDDYSHAFDKLQSIKEYVVKVLEDYLQ